VHITTLDTTSHEFTWTVETLGDYGSYLNDVAIVDENNIWVVGYITLGDSIYNAAHWDGNEWEIVRLPAVVYGGGLSMGSLTSIFALDENNIWCFSSAGSYLKWDGNEWTSEWIPYRDGGINAIWASSPEDVWFVGNNGSIVHYDGSGFTRIKSGTEVDLTDIYGIDKDHIWIGGNNTSDARSVLIGILGRTPQILYQRYTDGSNNLNDDRTWSPHIETLWAPPSSNRLLIAGGWGFYEINHHKEMIEYNRQMIAHFSYYPEKMRGTHSNNLFIVGDNATVYHFNGIGWHWYENIFNTSIRFTSISLIKSSITIVGYDRSSILRRAIILKGS